MDPTYHQRSRGMGTPLRPSKRSDRPRRPRFRRGCVVYRRGDAPSASIRGAGGSAFRLRAVEPSAFSSITSSSRSWATGADFSSVMGY